MLMLWNRENDSSVNPNEITDHRSMATGDQRHCRVLFQCSVILAITMIPRCYETVKVGLYSSFIIHYFLPSIPLPIFFTDSRTFRSLTNTYMQQIYIIYYIIVILGINFFENKYICVRNSRKKYYETNPFVWISSSSVNASIVAAMLQIADITMMSLKIIHLFPLINTLSYEQQFVQ